MKKSAKQELLSRLLVSSSVFILGSPIVTQAVVSIPAAAETISTSEIEEATLSTSENLSEQQVSEPAVTEETTTSETGGKEKAVEQETVETTQVEETEPDQRTEQSAENASTEEDTENSMAVDESQEVKSALAENILWTGMWGTAPATLTVEDEDRELTVTYIKNPTDPTNPTDPSKEPGNTPNNQTKPEATTPSTDKKPTAKVPETTKTATSGKILPKTGEQATPYGLYGGVALVVASLLGLFMKRSKRKSE